MKPEKGDLLDMDDKVYDPRALFAEIGLLITEGRTPELSKKGRVEGPHCPPIYGQNEHECDRHKEQCRKASDIIHQQDILWQNKIPMRIDVLLFPDCKHGLFESSVVEGPSLPSEENFELLERWDVQLVRKRSPERMEGFVKGRIHLQAVRSYLHFSQLSSWLISMGGALPLRTVYRIYAPGESVGPSFSRLPEIHNFPSADLGDVAMRTTCAYLPRQENPMILFCRSPSPTFEPCRRKKKITTDDTMQVTGARFKSEIREPVPSTSKYADEMDRRIELAKQMRMKEMEYEGERDSQISGKPPYFPKSKVEQYSKGKSEKSKPCPVSIALKRKVDQLSPTIQNVDKYAGNIQKLTSSNICDVAMTTNSTVIQRATSPMTETDTKTLTPSIYPGHVTPTKSQQFQKPSSLHVNINTSLASSKRLPSPKVLVTGSSKPEPSVFKKRCLDLEQQPESIAETENLVDKGEKLLDTSNFSPFSTKDYESFGKINPSDICDLIKPPSLGELEAYLSSLSNKTPRKQRIEDIPTTKCSFYLDDDDDYDDDFDDDDEADTNCENTKKDMTKDVENLNKTSKLCQTHIGLSPKKSYKTSTTFDSENKEKDVTIDTGNLNKTSNLCQTGSLSQKKSYKTSTIFDSENIENNVTVDTENLSKTSKQCQTRSLSLKKSYKTSTTFDSENIEKDVTIDTGNLDKTSQLCQTRSLSPKIACKTSTFDSDSRLESDVKTLIYEDKVDLDSESLKPKLSHEYECRHEELHKSTRSSNHECHKNERTKESSNGVCELNSDNICKQEALDEDVKHLKESNHDKNEIDKQDCHGNHYKSCLSSEGNKYISKKENRTTSKKEKALNELSIPCNIGAVDNAMTTLAQNLETMDIDDRPYSPFSRNSSPTLDHEVERHLSPKLGSSRMNDFGKAAERTISPSSINSSPEPCDTNSPTRGLSLCKQLLKKEFQQNVQKEITSSSQSMYKSLPSPDDIKNFQFMINRSASVVFNSNTGLPSRSSPAPIKKISSNKFDYDCSLTNVKAIKNAISCSKLTLQSENNTETIEDPKIISTSAPASTNCLLGNFEESVLNGRIEPVGVVDGFSVEIGAGGTFCPKHVSLPVAAYFFQLSDDNAPSPYLGHVNLEPLGKRGYHIPRTGTVQITLFNPNKTVVKMFVVMYDLSDMPANCQTFLRQRTLYMPVKPNSSEPSFLRYLIHLRFQSSKSGKIYLHTDIRLIFARDKFEFDPRVANYELRSFTEGPENPKFSPKK